MTTTHNRLFCRQNVYRSCRPHVSGAAESPCLSVSQRLGAEPIRAALCLTRDGRLFGLHFSAIEPWEYVKSNRSCDASWYLNTYHITAQARSAHARIGTLDKFDLSSLIRHPFPIEYMLGLKHQMIADCSFYQSAYRLVLSSRVSIDATTSIGMLPYR